LSLRLGARWNLGKREKTVGNCSCPACTYEAFVDWLEATMAVLTGFERSDDRLTWRRRGCDESDY
jgi:hypothetical protein